MYSDRSLSRSTSRSSRRSRGSRESRNSRESRGSRGSRGSKNSRVLRRSGSRRSSRNSRSKNTTISQGRRRTSKNTCLPGQVLRRGYRSSSYSRANKYGLVTDIGEAIVPPVCVSDVGQPGYSPEAMQRLTPHLLGKFGYASDVPEKERHRALNNAIKKYGISEVYRHLRDVVTLERWNPSVHNVMLSDFNYLRQKYYPGLGLYEPIGY